MLRFCFVLVLVFSVFSSFSQDDEKPKKIIYHPISKEVMREGVFLTFEEFRDNTPTRLYKLNRNPQKNIERSSLKEKFTGLPVIDAYGNETHLKEGEAYAFSDDQEVYMSYGKNYFKIEDFGSTYCVFTNEYDATMMTRYDRYGPSGSNVTGSHTAPNAVSRSPAPPSVYDYIVDMKTGEIHRLNNKLMKKKILVNYPDILEKFLNDKMKFYTIRLYITEVNIRNSED